MTTDDSHLMKQAEYARSRGLNKSTISRQVKSGLIPAYTAEKLVEPDEADRIRYESLCPGRRKVIPIEERTESLAPPGWKEGDDPMQALEIHGIEGDMMPISENSRINALILALELDRLSDGRMMQRILARVRRVIAEELRKELVSIKELLNEAEKEASR